MRLGAAKTQGDGEIALKDCNRDPIHFTVASKSPNRKIVSNCPRKPPRPAANRVDYANAESWKPIFETNLDAPIGP
jgi:hypothetical protein